MAFILSEDARQDLDDIWDYTFKNWGELQADNYINKLKIRLEWLAANPNLGTIRNELEEGYRSFNVGMHIVFYFEEGEDIKIVGIPHQSMDYKNKLSQQSNVDSINEQPYPEFKVLNPIGKTNTIFDTVS